MNDRTRVALVVTLVLASAGSAQDLGVKAAAQRAPVVLTHAMIHPVTGPVIEDGALRFESGKITAVGKVEPSAKDTVIDVRGHHVYPGLIACWTRLGLTEFDEVRQSIDHSETGEYTPEVKAAVGVNADSTLFPVTRSNGVLLAGVVPGGGTIAGRMSVLQLEGWTWEEMTVLDVGGLVVNWPAARRSPFGFGATGADADSARESNAAITRLDAYFSAARAYAFSRAVDPSTPSNIRYDAMAAVWASKFSAARPVFITAETLAQIEAAVAFGARHSLSVVIVGGRDAPLCAELLRARKVPVVVPGTHRLPRRGDSPYDESFTLPARLEAAGITWCLASGEETPHERNLPFNAGMATAHGLSREAALRAITLAPAQVLGISDGFGSIEVGKSATIFMTDGDPLEIMTQTKRAWIAGREIDLANKQTHLAEKYRTRYRQRALLSDK